MSFPQESSTSPSLAEWTRNTSRSTGMEKLETNSNTPWNKGIGRIMVDNDDELGLLDQLTTERAREQRIMLRITPGVDAQTHAKTTTGLRDSKFGFPLPSGQAEAAVVRAMAAPFLDLTGLHIHLGSPLFNVEPYADGIATIGRFAAEMKQRHG